MRCLAVVEASRQNGVSRGTVAGRKTGAPSHRSISDFTLERTLEHLLGVQLVILVRDYDFEAMSGKVANPKNSIFSPRTGSDRYSNIKSCDEFFECNFFEAGRPQKF